MKLLALSGSLREASYNTKALRILQALAPTGVVITLYESIGVLPHFNPDVESTDLPEIVKSFRQRVAEANGLVIACPEYAHGIPGSFKNALDWLVGSEDFSGKPVMLINTSPRSFHAQGQLAEVLATMAAWIVRKADIIVEMRGADLSSPALSGKFLSGLSAFVEACKEPPISA